MTNPVKVAMDTPRSVSAKSHGATVSDGKERTVSGSGRQGAHVSEMQRRRLLLAIGEVVAESGLEAATVGRVCEQAGVSRRTFYELFEDREECLLAAFDSAVERISCGARAAYEREGRWHERIRGALSGVLEQLDAEPDIARLCVIEASRAGPKVLERRRQVLDRIATILDQGRGEARDGSEPPPLTAQGIVGGAVSVIHGRLLACRFSTTGSARTGRETSYSASCPLVELTGPLMAMIVHPYLGAAAARRELKRPAPAAPSRLSRNEADPFRGLPIRFTYRTARVLATIASDPGASNRDIADSSGIADEGQMSRLLRRLNSSGLIENHGEGQPSGEPNAWSLTDRGQAIQAAIATQETAVR